MSEKTEYNLIVDIGPEYRRGKNVGYREGYEDGKKAGLQWLPIETAPKDGRTIIGAGTGTCNIGEPIFWSDGEGTYYKIPGWYDEGDRAAMTCAKPYRDISLWTPFPHAPEVSGD